jgi:hypothetical protein
MNKPSYKELQRIVSKSVIEHNIAEIVDRLARQSRFGRRPDGVSPELLITYNGMRRDLFGGKEGDSVGSRLAWHLIVKLSLFTTDY